MFLSFARFETGKFTVLNIFVFCKFLTNATRPSLVADIPPTLIVANRLFDVYENLFIYTVLGLLSNTVLRSGRTAGYASTVLRMFSFAFVDLIIETREFESFEDWSWLSSLTCDIISCS